MVKLFVEINKSVRKDFMEDCLIRETKKQKSFILAVALSGIVIMMNNTTVSIALPSFMEIFNVDVRTVQWVAVGYMLPLGMCMPLSGYLGQRYGIKKIYLIMLACMALASLGCALSWNFLSLVIFRFLTGIFAGIVVPFNISMIYYYIPKHKQIHFLGVSNMTNAFGLAVGPSLAGVLLQYSSWHVLFLFNVPLVLITVCLARRILPEQKGSEVTNKVDFLGILQVCLGTGLVLLAFTNLEVWGIKSYKFLLMFGVGICFVIIFIWRQKRIEHPLLNFAVLKSKAFAVTVLVNSCMAMILGITGILNNLFMQTLLGFSPIKAGITMFIPSVALLLGTEFSDKIYKMTSVKALVVGGMALAALGNFLMSSCQMNTSLIIIVLYLSFRYWGLGMAQTPLSDYGMKGISQEMAGHASSLLNWSKQTATVVSTNILTIILSINTSRYYAAATGSKQVVEGSAIYQECLLQAVNSDYFYLGVIATGAAVVALITIKKGKEKNA